MSLCVMWCIILGCISLRSFTEVQTAWSKCLMSAIGIRVWIEHSWKPSSLLEIVNGWIRIIRLYPRTFWNNLWRVDHLNHNILLLLDCFRVLRLVRWPWYFLVEPFWCSADGKKWKKPTGIQRSQFHSEPINIWPVGSVDLNIYIYIYIYPP